MKLSLHRFQKQRFTHAGVAPDVAFDALVDHVFAVEDLAGIVHRPQVRGPHPSGRDDILQSLSRRVVVHEVVWPRLVGDEPFDRARNRDLPSHGRESSGERTAARVRIPRLSRWLVS